MEDILNDGFEIYMTAINAVALRSSSSSYDVIVTIIANLRV